MNSYFQVDRLEKDEIFPNFQLQDFLFRVSISLFFYGAPPSLSPVKFSIIIKDIDTNQDITSTHLIDPLAIEHQVTVNGFVEASLKIKLLPSEFNGKRCLIQVREVGNTLNALMGETEPFNLVRYKLRITNPWSNVRPYYKEPHNQPSPVISRIEILQSVNDELIVTTGLTDKFRTSLYCFAPPHGNLEFMEELQKELQNVKRKPLQNFEMREGTCESQVRINALSKNVNRKLFRLVFAKDNFKDPMNNTNLTSFMPCITDPVEVLSKMPVPKSKQGVKTEKSKKRKFEEEEGEELVDEELIIPVPKTKANSYIPSALSFAQLSKVTPAENYITGSLDILRAMHNTIAQIISRGEAALKEERNRKAHLETTLLNKSQSEIGSLRNFPSHMLEGTNSLDDMLNVGFSWSSIKIPEIAPEPIVKSKSFDNNDIQALLSLSNSMNG